MKGRKEKCIYRHTFKYLHFWITQLDVARNMLRKVRNIATIYIYIYTLCEMRKIFHSNLARIRSRFPDPSKSIYICLFIHGDVELVRLPRFARSLAPNREGMPVHCSDNFPRYRSQSNEESIRARENIQSRYLPLNLPNFHFRRTLPRFIYIYIRSRYKRRTPFISLCFVFFLFYDFITRRTKFREFTKQR